MSNIHGISNYRGSAINDDGEGNFSGENGQIPNFLNGFMVAQQGRPEPRKETFREMLKYTFCPGLTYRYFIAIISIL